MYDKAISRTKEDATKDAIKLLKIVQNVLLQSDMQSDNEALRHDEEWPKMSKVDGCSDVNMIYKGANNILTIFVYDDLKVKQYMDDIDLVKRLADTYGEHVRIILGGSRDPIYDHQYVESIKDLVPYHHKYDNKNRM